jgi:hypothetical protein
VFRSASSPLVIRQCFKHPMSGSMYVIPISTHQITSKSRRKVHAIVSNYELLGHYRIMEVADRPGEGSRIAQIGCERFRTFVHKTL